MMPLILETWSSLASLAGKSQQFIASWKKRAPPQQNRNKHADDDWQFLTKGDDNKVDDRGLYTDRQKWVTRRHIRGEVIGFIPYLGFVPI